MLKLEYKTAVLLLFCQEFCLTYQAMVLKSNFYFITLVLSFFVIIGTSNNIEAGDLASIPLERMDPDGNYDQSGLAKKLAKAVQQDAILSAFMSNKDIYVAQIGNKVILKGRVRAGDQSTIQRIVNIAYNIEGIKEVNTSQIETF